MTLRKIATAWAIVWYLPSRYQIMGVAKEPE